MGGAARARRLGALALAVVALGMLSGCASTRDSLDAALRSAVSATASAELHTHQLREGRAPASVAATGYGDAMTELTSAQDDVSGLGVDPAVQPTRDRALSSIRSAVDAVLSAQDALNSGRDLGPAEGGLRDALRILRSEEKRISS